MGNRTHYWKLYLHLKRIKVLIYVLIAFLQYFFIRFGMLPLYYISITITS